MKNTITEEQFSRLYDLATDYNETHDSSGEFEYITVYDYEDEDGNPYVSLAAYDWDHSTDFDTLLKLLREAGVQIDNEAKSDTGTAERRRKVCRAYFLDLPLIKEEKEAGNELKIDFVGINKIKGHRLWVKLTCSGVEREVCYLRHSGYYMHDCGEDEPPMSKKLLSMFHGKEGEAALRKCAKKGESVTLKA